MAGSISVLGLGGSPLNADTIDQLREADKKVMLNPIEKRAEKNTKQKEDLQALVSGLKSVQDAASVFADELNYLKRTASSTGNGGSITAEDGVDAQSGQIYVTQLAQKSIIQSKGFLSEDEIISSVGGETLNISLGDSNYEIEITAGMKLSDLKSKIQDKTNGQIEASILNTGGNEGYSLILKSKNTGADNEIAVTASESFDLGFNTIQTAQNAEFTYNGISITRDTNTVNDLVTGVTFNLEKEDEYINYDIEQDLDGMSDSFEAFVNSYNETMTLIDSTTGYDNDTKIAGSFQGDTRVTSIRSSLTSMLFKSPIDDMTITDYGIEVTKEGTMTFDRVKFEAKMKEDPTAFESLFRGETKTTEAVSVGGKVGYTTTQVNEIQEDGSIVTTSQYLPISEDKTISYDSIKINGISLPEVKLLASNTPSQNTQVLANAINSISAETGVKASVSGSGDKIVLTNAEGGEITLSEATSDAVNFLGLNNGKVIGSKDYTDGIFNNIDDYFDSILVGEFSTLGLLESSLNNEAKRLDDEWQKTMDRITSRYEIMEAQFASYNSIISQFENSFNSLQLQIDQSVARN